MMLTVLGLPQSTKYQDLKALIKQECDIHSFILDNMTSHTNGTKKVQIGLNDDRDGAQVIKCLNGYRMGGNLLMVQPFEKSGYNAPNDSNQTRPPPWAQNKPDWSQSYVSPQGHPEYGYQNQGHVTYTHQQSVQPQRIDPYGQPSYVQDRIIVPSQSYQPKVSEPSVNQPRSHVLRTVEIIDAPLNRYISQEKPVTIMKDNFKGPTGYLDHSSKQQYYQSSSQGQSPWNHQNLPAYSDDRKFPQTDKRQLIKSSEELRSVRDNYKDGRDYSPQRLGRRMSPIGRRLSPTSRRMSPSARRLSPGPSRVSPMGRRMSPPGRRISPSSRRISPSSRRLSPSSRRLSPAGRRMSPTGRRLSPPGRRLSPSARRMSPPAPRLSSSGRRISPPGDRRMASRHSPSRRLVSPSKRISPGRRVSPSRRYSPTRREKSVEKYVPSDSRVNFKQVRPAYEPTPQAPKQDVYSGGYRTNVHEKIQYPLSGVRQADQRNSPWQQERDKAAFVETMKKREEERRDIPRMQTFDISRGSNKRIIEQKIESKRVHTPTRNSRSPIRRERSPVRDRYRRHSPSPPSPRRSWALEKRRSPDKREAPPPPIWPGQNVREDKIQYPQPRESYPERPSMTGKPKGVPVWETSTYKDTNIHPRHEVRHLESPERRFEHEIRGREMVPSRNSFTREHRDDFRRPDSTQDRKPDFEPSSGSGPSRPFGRVEYSPRSEIQHRVEEKKHEFRTTSDSFNKEIEDIRRRAMEFHKKTEERRRSEDEDRHRRDDLDHKRYPQREEDVRHRDNNPRHIDPERRHYRKERDYFESGRDQQRYPDTELRNFDLERRFHDENRQELYSPSDQFKQNRNRENHRQSNETNAKPKAYISPMKAKIEKAANELVEKIVRRQDVSLTEDVFNRVTDLLKTKVTRIISDMFGDKDTPFVELIIKFNTKFTLKDQDRFFEEVMSNLPKSLKRPATDASEIPPKRRSPISSLKQDLTSRETALPQRSRLRARPILRGALHNRRVPTAVATSKPATVKKRPMPIVETRKPPVAVPEKKPKPVLKAVKVTEKTIDAPSVEPTPDGHYELNHLMSRVLQNELQNIMIKVWQVLPDNPPNDAEKMVVEKLRNEVGDEFCNALGLNITKRLLNIHNALFVRVLFSKMPNMDIFKAFWLKYDISVYKRVSSVHYIFAAQLRTIQAFDRICNAKYIQCGDAKVIVTPCYKFTQCPVKLNTNFVLEKAVDLKSVKKTKTETTAEQKSETKVSTTDQKNKSENNDPKLQSTSNTEQKKYVKEITELNIKSETDSAKAEIVSNIGSVTISDEKVTHATNEESANTPQANKVTTPMAQIKKTEIVTVIVDDKGPAKVTPQKKSKDLINILDTPVKVTITASETDCKPKTDIVKPKVNESAEKTKVSVETKPKIEISNKKDDKTEITAKTQQNTSENDKINQAKPAAVNKSPQKANINNSKNKNASLNTKTLTKPIKKGQQNLKTPNKYKEIPEKFYDEDEMDDQEILALLSGGIVLDECGSDEE